MKTLKYFESLIFDTGDLIPRKYLLV